MEKGQPMMKKLVGLVVVLLAFVFLSACAIFRAGAPCLGYGCPNWATSGSPHAANTPAQSNGQSLAEKNAPPDQHAIAGK